MFPASAYLISAAIVVTTQNHIRLIGGGAISGTSITSNSPTDDIIRFDAAVVGNLTGAVECLVLLKSVTSSAGYAINFRNGTLLEVLQDPQGDERSSGVAAACVRGIGLEELLEIMTEAFPSPSEHPLPAVTTLK